MKKIVQISSSFFSHFLDGSLSNRKQIILGVSCGMMLLLGLAVFKFFEITKAIAEHSHFTPPPEAITAIKVIKSEWDQKYTTPGSLAPVQGVTVSAEKPGVVSKIHFLNGSTVKKGEILVSQDTSLEEAELKGALARLHESQRDYERKSKLKISGAVSQGDFESSASKLSVSQADVQTLKVTIEKKKIIAPFDGVTGARLINEGQYLSEGAPIVSIQSLKNLYVQFSVPQSYANQIKSNQKIIVSLLQDEAEKISGIVETVNPEVTTTTRQIQITGFIDNSELRLLPGMFISVDIVLGAPRNVIAVPQSSINYAPYGDTVYILENMKGSDGKEFLGAKSQVVTLGERRGDMIEIVSGLSPGTVIASSGVFKLRPNASVSVVETISPSQNLSPQPEDS